jgi:shikimate dehydrogenase
VTRRFAGIIGHPVAHSLSPVIQKAAFDAHGLDVSYKFWDTTNAALGGRLVSLRDPKYLGANVTIPHKQAVLPHLDELGGQSARIGAVNTIVSREGRLFGFNTDGQGFVAALKNESYFDPAGKRILLLGAGGAARGIAFALAAGNPETITIWNRNESRAMRLAEDVSAIGARVAAAQAAQASPAEYDLVVNCTSVGMHGTGTETELPCALEGALPTALFVDIVYAPEETAWLRSARESGLRTQGGLPMLVYQGALAFELWTGVPAPVEVMFEAAHKALIERNRSQQ